MVQKVVQSIAGEPENIKKLHRSNHLLIEVSKKAHAENLLRAQTFHDLTVQVYPHTSLKNGELKDTNTFVFTFNTSVLPKTVKVAYFRFNVEVYIPNLLRCHNCQKYGLHEDRCSKDPICSKCGQTAEHLESRCTNELTCVNCGEKHSADSLMSNSAQRKKIYYV